MRNAFARGFTLVEVIIVVAIIGILAAIAIPNFLRFQLRARTAELPTNLSAIRTAVVGRYASDYTFVDAAPSPDTCANGATPGLSTVKCDWMSAGQFDNAGDGTDSDSLGFSGLGWRPEGAVFGQYSAVSGCPIAGRHRCFTIGARADLDGDGNPQVWIYAIQDVALSNAGGLFGVPLPLVDETGVEVWGTVAKSLSSGAF